MSKLLFIGHAYHNRTKSSQFFLDLLKTRYDVVKIAFDPYGGNVMAFDEIRGEVFDVVVLWQIMPMIHWLRRRIHCNKIVFFPMYDSVPPIFSPRWWGYAGCSIINFSSTLHKKCEEYGFPSHYIQFFPKPEVIRNYGDARKAFLWYRTPEINPLIVEKTAGRDVDQLYLHRAPDPGVDAGLSLMGWKGEAKPSEWFETKEQMNEYMQECAIYYAPRSSEGIGMSFLEAMAFGRCVVAPDCPTMNEYIEDGVTGLLYDLDNPARLDFGNVRKIQDNTASYMRQGYERWEREKSRIFDWIDETPMHIYCEKTFVEKFGIKAKRMFGLVVYCFFRLSKALHIACRV